MTKEKETPTAEVIADDELALTPADKQMLAGIEDTQKAAEEARKTEWKKKHPSYIKHVAWVRNNEGKPIRPMCTQLNVEKILDDCPFSDKIKKRQPDGDVVVTSPLPWESKYESDYPRLWKDEDTAHLIAWLTDASMQVQYSKADVERAVSDHADEREFNPIIDYLSGLKWDGTPRLDMLFIDWLTMEDTQYTRIATRTALMSIVKRALKNGSYHDTVLVLVGGQGIGKTKIWDLLSYASGHVSTNDWAYSEFQISKVGDKDEKERTKGKWIVNVDELQKGREKDIGELRQYVTQTADTYRRAYGKANLMHKRSFAIVATTNSTEILHDADGSRRWVPIFSTLPWSAAKDTANPHNPMAIWYDAAHDTLYPEYKHYVDQIWAEAKYRVDAGESTEIGSYADVADAWQDARARATEHDGRTPAVEKYLDMLIPNEYAKYTAEERNRYYEGYGKHNLDHTHDHKMNYVSIEQIMQDVLCVKRADRDYKEYRKMVKGIMAQEPEWGECSSPAKVPDYDPTGRSYRGVYKRLKPWKPAEPKKPVAQTAGGDDHDLDVY